MKFQSFNHMSLSSGGEGPIGVLGGQRPSQHNTVHSYVLLNEQCYRFSNALVKISTYIINTIYTQSTHLFQEMTKLFQFYFHFLII